ncbi:MAG: superoxide dismutase [Firmicutes bacterium]|nr:superoxide dismutase [Bacillota bacterium]
MFNQYQLPYGSDALEPVIDALTVETHHGKHHAAYTKNLNDAAEKAGVSDMDIEELLGSLDKISDEGLRKAIRNNGGGFYNHNLYFSTIAPNGAKEPTGALKAKIDETFGSFDALKQKLTDLATGQFGSGWAWLSANKAGDLMASASPNQDNPISEGTGFIPMVAIDVWEHAYYLKYKNLRGDYIKALFDIMDWKAVEENYARITK